MTRQTLHVNGHAAPATSPLEADDAERGLISGLLIDTERISLARKLIGCEAFRLHPLGVVFRAMCDLEDQGTRPEPTALSTELRNQAPPDGNTWIAYLLELQILEPHPENAAFYAQRVRDAYARRQLKRIAARAIEEIERGGGDPAELAAELAGKADEISRASNQSRALEIMSTCIADVESEAIHWLWPGLIALGKLTMISGDPGVGKSFLSLDLAARVSKGSPWPDDPNAKAPLGSTLLLADEDDVADTIRPRLEAAGADLKKIHSIKFASSCEANGAQPERWINLQRDIAAIERKANQIGDVKLIVIDPISAYLGKTRQNDNGEVRSVLGPLGAMAARLGAVVLLINHLRKGEGDALSKSIGSTGFVAVCRSAFVVARDKADASGVRRLFLPSKNNIGNDRTGLSFALTSTMYEGPQPCVAWGAEPVRTTADEALAPPPKRGGRPPTEQSKAIDFLREALANGPRLFSDLKREAEEQHLAWRTVERAKEKLEVHSFRDPPGKGKQMWKLPDPSTESDSQSTPPHSGGVP